MREKRQRRQDRALSQIPASQSSAFRLPAMQQSLRITHRPSQPPAGLQLALIFGHEEPAIIIIQLSNINQSLGMAAMLVKLRALTICQNWPTGRVNLKISYACHYLSELADRTAQFVNIMPFFCQNG